MEKTSIPSTIMIKTDKIKIYDTGFIDVKNGLISVKVLNLGVQILDIQIIKSKICIDSNCFKDEIFNEKFLSKEYENDFLKKIVLKEPLFDGKEVNSSENGFTQELFKDGKFDIIYRVDKKQSYFKDKINKILIKIRRIDG
jgi:hypothetical protein